MWHADPEILRWTGVEPGQSEERTLEWIRFASDAAARGIAWHFVIEVDGALAGSCDVRLPDRSDPRIGEIGYLVAAPFRR